MIFVENNMLINQGYQKEEYTPLMLLSLLFTVSLSFISTPTTTFALSPVACTMDAKLCPDGVTYVGRDGNRNCQWQLCPGEKDTCAPYVCNDGTRVNKCTQDGTVINYFAAPCLTHGGEVDAEQSFSDVPATHVNAEAIAYVRAQGIVRGYPDGTFKPDTTINRAEFTAMITGRQFNSAETVDSCIDRTVTPATQTVFFRDVLRSDWFAKYICIAKERHIIDGYPDGTLKPGATITLAEASKILTTLFVGNVGSDPVWYARYVGTMADAHAIPLSITRVDQQITRGELAEMIWRMKTGNIDKPSPTYEQLELNTRTETHGTISTFHHIIPTFSFQFPAGWTLSDDRGDMDIYIHKPNSDLRITLTYCANENCNGPLGECSNSVPVTVPILGVKGCLFTYEDGHEQWTNIGMPVNETYFFTVEGTKDELKILWPILAKIRTSLRMQ